MDKSPLQKRCGFWGLDIKNVKNIFHVLEQFLKQSSQYLLTVQLDGTIYQTKQESYITIWLKQRAVNYKLFIDNDIGVFKAHMLYIESHCSNYFLLSLMDVHSKNILCFCRVRIWVFFVECGSWFFCTVRNCFFFFL